MPSSEWNFWERPAFLNALPCPPFEVRASRSLPPGGNALVPTCLTAIVFMAVLSPFWKGIVSLVPSTSYLRDVVELSPIGFILLSGGCAELIRDRLVQAKRKVCKFRVTDDTLEFHDLWSTKKINWDDVTQITWDSDTGKNQASYMVAEIATDRCKIRVSEQYFKREEVSMAYGAAMLKTDSRTLND